GSRTRWRLRCRRTGLRAGRGCCRRSSRSCRRWRALRRRRGRARPTSCSRSAACGRRRRFLWRGCARADVCEVLAHPHFSQEDRLVENVIAWCAAAIAPFSFDIVGDIIGAHLLAMTIDAAVGSVNVCATLEHSRLRPRINVRSLFVGFRVEISDLPGGDHREAYPRKGKRAEDSQEKRGEAFHKYLTSADCPNMSGLEERKREASPFINGLRMSRLQL